MQSRIGSERDILQALNYAQSTHNSVVSSSVGMALLHLRNVYLDKSPTESEIEKFIESCFAELTKLGKDERYASFDSAINFIINAARELTNFHDRVTLFHLLESGEMGSQIYIFPLKEVLALVWKAVNTNDAYMQNYEGNPAQQKIQACEDKQSRIVSFFNRLQELQANPVCHHGQRNELVFVLNKTHFGIDILEDSKTPVLMVLKEELNKRLMAVLKSREGKLEPTLASAMIDWMENNNASDLLNLLDPNDEIRAKLSSLFISHGASPNDIKLNDSINHALAYLEFPRDHQAYPVLAAAAELLGEIEDHTQPERSRMLQSIQDGLKAGDVSKWEESVVDFYRVYNTHKELRTHKTLLILSGEMTTEIYDRHSNNLAASFQAEKIVLDDGLKSILEECHEKVHRSKRNMLQDTIENFFVHWFDALKNKDELSKKRWYQLLLDQSVTSKIILSDSHLEQFQRDASSENELDITPFMINRLFLHAILVTPQHWSEGFTTLFESTVKFVENQFNQDAAYEAKSALYRDSYQNLLPQLQYLLRQAKDEDVENNPRPQKMLLLPVHAKSAAEWAHVFSLLPEGAVDAVLRSSRLAIQRAVNEFKDCEEILESLPIQSRPALISGLSDKIKEIIRDGYQLASCFSELLQGDRVTLISALGDKIKDIIQDGKQLASCFSGLPQDAVAALISALGDKIKDIIQDGHQLASCFYILPQDADVVLISALGDKIKDIIQDDHQLASCFYVLPQGAVAVLISALGDKIKDIIQDGSQLANCFSKLPQGAVAVLISALGDKIKDIIQDDSQLANCFRELSQGDRVTLISALGDKIKDIIQDGYNLAICFSVLPQGDRVALISALGDIIKDIIQDGHQLASCFSGLHQDAVAVLISALDDKIKGIIQNHNQLGYCFNRLPQGAVAVFISALGDKIKDIIQNGNHLANCFSELPQGDRVALISALGDKIKDIIQDGSQLANFFRELPKGDRVTLISALGDKVRDIFMNGKQFRGCLRLLPKASRWELISALGDKLSDKIYDGAQLVDCLDLLSKENHPAFISMLGIEWVKKQIGNSRVSSPMCNFIGIDIVGNKLSVTLDSDYYSAIDEKIFTPIYREVTRLNHLGAFEKAKEVLLAALEMQENIVATVDKNLPPEEMKLAIHDAMKTELTRLSEAGCVTQHRNPVADFFKGLLGVLLSVPLLFVPLAFEGYRDTFFATTTEKSLKAMKLDLQGIRPGR